MINGSILIINWRNSVNNSRLTVNIEASIISTLNAIPNHRVIGVGLINISRYHTPYYNIIDSVLSDR